MTQIVTFYSYKGGVGRTMALVNTGYALAKRGARVLMVDFDLEAPGMSHFFGKVGTLRPNTAKRDALDLLLEAKRSLKEVDEGRGALEPPLSLGDYILPIELPSGTSDTISRYLEGRLDLLPAALGQRSQRAKKTDHPSADYLDRMELLDLAGIFGPEGPGHRFGAHVGDYFRSARFKAPGDIVFALRDPVLGGYDFVLIDSRTGLNEISGLCIGPLCDSLVICTGLNEQNVAGTGFFLEKAGLLDKEKGKTYLLVVGPVPPWRSHETSRRIAQIRNLFSSQDVIEVPYHPVAALEERIFVLDHPPEAIGRAFEALAGQLEESSRRGSLRVIEKTLGRMRTLSDEQPDPEFLSTWMATAESVPAFLRRRVDRDELTALGAPPFPTLFESMVVPRKAIGWSEVDRAALGAAVAIYRQQSKPVVGRIVELLDLCERGGVREELLVRLALFFRRLFGRRGEVLFARSLTSADREKLTEIVHRKRRHHDAAEVALLLSHGIEITREDLEDISYRLLDLGPFELKNDRYLEVGTLLKINYSGQEVDLGSLGEQMVVQTDEWLEGLWQKRHRGRKRGERFHWRMDVPGFSSALAFASVLAMARGESAVEQVLKWIEMGRLTYGYGWRVMINWKRLDAVKETSRFQEFLAREDAAIEEVESRFDRGIWPL